MRNEIYLVLFIIIAQIAVATPDPGHDISSVGPGTAPSGNYVFPDNLTANYGFMKLNASYIENAPWGTGTGSSVSSYPADNITTGIFTGSYNFTGAVQVNASSSAFSIGSLYEPNTFYVGTNGYIGFGTATPWEEFTAASSVDADFDLQTSSSGNSSSFHFRRSYGSLSSYAFAASGAEVGKLEWETWKNATNNVTWGDVGSIVVKLDSTPTNESTPGYMVFGVTATGSTAVTERLRLTAAGLSTFSSNITFNSGYGMDYSYIKNAPWISSYTDTNDSATVATLITSNSSMNDRMNAMESSNTTQDSLISARALPGSCSAGNAVLTTTTSGVTCTAIPVAPTSFDYQTQLTNYPAQCAAGQAVTNLSTGACSTFLTTYTDTNDTTRVEALETSNSSMNTRVLAMESSNSTQSDLINAKAMPGSCGAGNAVQTTTTGGVTCIAIPAVITYSAGQGLILSSTTFSHNDSSSVADSDNSARTYIQDLTFDTYGHVLTIGTATETVVDTNDSTTVAALVTSNTTQDDLISARALPGTCPSGQVVMNTTTTGVQCVVVTATASGGGNITGSGAYGSNGGYMAKWNNATDLGISDFYDENDGHSGLYETDPQFDFQMAGNRTMEIGGQFDNPALSFGDVQNLLLRSEEFDNSAWSGNRVNVAAAIAANGDVGPLAFSNNAEKLVGNISSTMIFQNISNSTLGTWTFTIWVKTTSGQSNVNQNFSLSLDDSNATLVYANGTIYNFTATPIYKRFSITQNVQDLHTRLRPTIRYGTSNISVWGAQLENWPNGRAYTRTTSGSTTINSRVNVYGQLYTFNSGYFGAAMVAYSTIGIEQGPGATSADGIMLQSTTSSTAATPIQRSPRLRFRANVWNSTASEPMYFTEEVIPDGNNTRGGKLVWKFANNTGTYGEIMSLTDEGNLGIGIVGSGTSVNIQGGNVTERLVVNGSISVFGSLKDQNMTSRIDFSTGDVIITLG